MARSADFLTLIDSQSNPGGSVVVNANKSNAFPANVSVKRLFVEFRIDFTGGTVEDPTTFVYEDFARGIIITSRYSDQSPMIEAVNASLLDFAAAAFRTQDTRFGGDLAMYGRFQSESAGSVSLVLPIEFTDPLRREPNDVSIPLAEIGQFNISAAAALATITNGTVTGFRVNLRALCCEEKEPVLGLRPVYSLQSVVGQTTNWDNNDRLLRSIQAYSTVKDGNTPRPLAANIANGFQLFADGQMIVDGSTLTTLESLCIYTGERHYKPTGTAAANSEAFSSNAAHDPIMSVNNGSQALHARVFDIGESLSATDLTPVSKLRLQISNPGANVTGVQLLTVSYEKQTAESVNRRLRSLGLSTVMPEPNVTDTQPGQLTTEQKWAIPALVPTRGA